MYEYDGSLTTPSCDELVVFRVIEEAIPISRRDWQAFRNVKGENNQVMKLNYRPLQNVNGRRLEYFNLT